LEHILLCRDKRPTNDCDIIETDTDNWRFENRASLPATGRCVWIIRPIAYGSKAAELAAPSRTDKGPL
jgi:hypothetical protein